jgi:dienelactone hydrolase
MNFISGNETDGVNEQLFELEVAGEQLTGALWYPARADGPRPLVLMGHGGSQNKKFPPLVARAQRYAQVFGFAVAAIDMPGHGGRRGAEQAAQFGAEIGARLAQGQPVGEFVSHRMTGLAAQAVPEWQAALDALQSLDFIGAGGPVGYWGLSMGGAIGVFLAAAEPRITAAVFGLAGLFPGQEAMAAAAAKISIPLEFVVQWQDEMVPREASFALFEAFGSKEKSLHANPGTHGRVTNLEVENWERFFQRHLGTPKVF